MAAAATATANKITAHEGVGFSSMLTADLESEW